MYLNIWVLIIGMAVVTYIPRALPAILTDKIKYGPQVEKFLRLIPYTAMAALIFPGVLTTDEDHIAIGLVGGVVAAILAWKKMPVIVCVLAAIAADLLLYLFAF